VNAARIYPRITPYQRFYPILDAMQGLTHGNVELLYHLGTERDRRYDKRHTTTAQEDSYRRNDNPEGLLAFLGRFVSKGDFTWKGF
jgi:hypothetical protein